MFLQGAFGTILHFETINRIMLCRYISTISTMTDIKPRHDIQDSNHEDMHPTWVSMISFFIKKCKKSQTCHALGMLQRCPNKARKIKFYYIPLDLSALNKSKQTFVNPKYLR